MKIELLSSEYILEWRAWEIFDAKKVFFQTGQFDFGVGGGADFVR